MDIAHDDVSGRVITRALGEELRRVRESVGWSQAELAQRMPTELHVKTLATYEQGARQCTVPRLVEICRTLGVTAPDVLGRALLHAEVDLHTVGMQVDLQALCRDTRTELRPLRRWARNRLSINPACEVALLDRGAIQEMAAIFGQTLSSLVHHLEMFSPQMAPRRERG